jgi:TFIIF-interacting CTD phosphatase-like protein
VYRRPHLNEFLTKLSKLGVVSVFTANKAEYADPILDRIDPNK